MRRIVWWLIPTGTCMNIASVPSASDANDNNIMQLMYDLVSSVYTSMHSMLNFELNDTN